MNVFSICAVSKRWCVYYKNTCIIRLNGNVVPDDWWVVVEMGTNAFETHLDSRPNGWLIISIVFIFDATLIHFLFRQYFHDYHY